MDSPPIYFVSGLPRSGSTLLMNLLGQNPAHHVTPTNGLLDLMVKVRDTWTDLIEFRSQGLENIRPRIGLVLRGMLENFYRQEFKEGKVVFDKCRGWLAYIELMEEVLQRPVTVLVTVRDIRAIAASFEKIYQRNPLTTARPTDYCRAQTVEGRTEQLLIDSGVITLAINRLRDAIRRLHRSRILIIPYNQLCTNPQIVMSGLHEQLGLPPFQYDPNHVQQITQEDDAVHGAALHTIRPKVELLDETPWKGVLPDSVADQLAAQFADIQGLAQVRG